MTPSTPLSTFIRLRWVATVAVLFALITVTLGLPSVILHPVTWILWGLYLITNLFLGIRRRFIVAQAARTIILFLLIFDLVYLTALVALNGGAHNPFAILFISIATAGAMLLDQFYLFVIVSLSLVGLGIIYSGSFEGEHAMHMMHDMGAYTLHLRGMWFANSIAVILASAWVYYLRKRNENTEIKHREAQRIISHLERVDSMGRLLASAAHKLNTPLGTLQLGISELQDEMNPIDEVTRKNWLNNLQVALNQIQSVVSQLKDSETETISDRSQQVELSDYLEIAAHHWAKPRACRIVFSSNQVSIAVPRSMANELVQCLHALLDNAREALGSLHESVIDVELSISEQTLILSVTDRGPGMTDDVMRHALDPLFTTKATGTGLGLYICHQIAKTHHGHIDIASKLGKGTTVKITLDRKTPS